ncbi:MAG: DUF2283 domain-containing protein [Cyanobacteria bacterium J06627_8]
MGNILYIEKCSPCAEQESEELEDDLVARFNPVSGDIENLEILFFSKRLLSDNFNGNLLDLPVIANLRIAE